jgi:hypothetical protein
LPAYGPNATSSTAAQCSDITATTRIIGNPSPGFCADGWGYAF